MDLDVIKTAKLLIALENGEQHILTIIPHKENCTVGELLGRIDVPVEHDLNASIKVEPLPFIDDIQIKVEPDENLLAVQQQQQQLHQPNIASTSQAQTMQLQNLQIQLPVSHCNM